MNDITDGFPRTINVLGSLMDEFRQHAEENPRIILRYLTDDPRDDNIREGIMVLARDTSDQRIRQWYQALLEKAALRYAKETVKKMENDESALSEFRKLSDAAHVACGSRNPACDSA